MLTNRIFCDIVKTEAGGDLGEAETPTDAAAETQGPEARGCEIRFFQCGEAAAEILYSACCLILE